MKNQAPAGGPVVRKRIFIVDDHPLVREGLAQRIHRHPDYMVCGEADNARQALTGIARLAPDLVIADINLPGPDGLELIKNLQAQRPELPILVLSMHDESLFAERVLRAGARGYVSKQAGGQKLMEAIGRIFQGHIFLSEGAADRLLGSLGSRKKTAPPSPIALLTDRELEVFNLIGAARQTRQISRELHMSAKTVEAHRAAIKRKLKAKTGPELTRQAVLWVEGARPSERGDFSAR